MAGLTTDGLYNGSNVATDFNRGTRNQTYLDLAKRAALKVIAESGAGLIDNYGDLFAAKSFNNNSESLFQLQWLPATQANSSACGNTMVRFLAWSTMVADKDAWGGATYCSWNLWEEFKTYKDETLVIPMARPRIRATREPTSRNTSLAQRPTTAASANQATRVPIPT